MGIKMINSKLKIQEEVPKREIEQVCINIADAE